MNNMPLLVQILFHPRSVESRNLAQHIHRQLNDNDVVPGLRIPTMFHPYTIDGNPSGTPRLDIAERTFIIILADDQFSIDDRWCSFAAVTWIKCQSTTHRCIPFQLSDDAWPLDDRLKDVSFARANLHSEGKDQTAFVVRRVLIELTRYLLNRDLNDDSSKVPVKLFISHAKVDLEVEPKVVNQIINYLKEDQPVEAWVDSGDIPSGSKFAEAIAEGVKHTSLLVILTNNYASREWCREEVLLAKEHQRPFAIVDALTHHETRSFPYIGNVPRIRWDNNLKDCIDLILKESLRHLHTKLILDQTKRDGDMVFLMSPELATLVGLSPNTQVLYPDPPLGFGESRRLAKTNVNFTTPIQRLTKSQLLRGKLIVLSMSESTDINYFGFDNLHFETAMLELSRYLLIQGASLTYGGHFGPEGYTQKLFELVQMHNKRDDLNRPGGEIAGVDPFDRIVNHRGWPLPRLTVKQQAQTKRVSQTIELPRPYEINSTLHPDFIENPTFFSADKSVLHRYAWARGMTEMRAFQADQNRSGVKARIVLGGTIGPTDKIMENGERKLQWYSGRIPGVLEEVALSVKHGQPVFLIGAFGGAAKLIIDIILGENRKEATWEYQKQAPFSEELRKLYGRFGQYWWEYEDIVAFLHQKGLKGINPLLSENEQLELFETIDPLRMVEIVLKGLKEL